ncbi:hypothetical protein DL93DRAFT_2163289 [Clavulina sp. PMI_390]|nr:hypothetical protein DL93DRAFT_2163289 [Clavulina sp. PMI_390]
MASGYIPLHEESNRHHYSYFHQSLTLQQKLSRHQRTITFYGAAVLSGLIVQYFIFRARFHTLIPSADPSLICSNSSTFSSPHDPIVSSEYVRGGLGTLIEPSEDQPTISYLRDMVASTKGYYARDYSVWLGWNNMRYIIEGSALHAKLLNRTLVIPSYVYVRSCETERPACTSFATMVNREEAMGKGYWDGYPAEDPTAWLVPIDAMIDLANMRKHVPVVTVAQFLRIKNLSTTLESKNGRWDRTIYHGPATNPPSTSLVIVPNQEFDHDLEVLRVDTLPEDLAAPPKLDLDALTIHDELLQQMGKQKTIRTDVVAKYLQRITGERWGTQENRTISDVVVQYGLTSIHTFSGLPSVFSKAVDNPVIEIAPIELMRGFVNDFAQFNEEVLLVEGEVHGDRKPGFMAFTSEAARDAYQKLVLNGIVHPPAIQALADAIADRMTAMNGGRTWMSAHWRRGDFVVLNWNHNRTSHEGVDMLLSRLDSGRGILEGLKAEAASPSSTNVEREFSGPLPLPGDQWYLATDERDPDALAYARSKNAVLLSDVLASMPAMRRLVGWPLLFTDIVALVEQEVMARSAFFFGYAYSSVAGGVVNIRTSRGLDHRAMILDGT